MSSRIKAHGIVPRKSLGQNFLADEATARRIVDAAEVGQDDLVLEIGPGAGALTKHLVKCAGWVVAIELDQTLIPALREELGEAQNVTIVHGDALKVDFVQLAQDAARMFGRPFQVTRFVANLPYYITSAAIRRILECGLSIASVVLTVQTEVAKRVTAQPPDMSLLAVSVQFYGRPDLLFRISPNQFYPQPGVESSILRITPHNRPPAIDAQKFFRVVKAGFSQPRKQLRNTLAAGLKITKSEAEAALRQSGIEPGRRAETLSLEEWKRLVVYLC
ncbi:16S rRNA (adenine(1518)-N(6)/adenine(1519)-N(6))-dimethyltransferase RsmA [Candidatus Roseilinea sp. NK_OTU-006]|uniref:16S rRNA (adenine(1518)-N(6)/adenine(1519)-N(6))- dimethyltransferase RsmA n=1 Tax=Candidatus Roseilinea sp. NK_OTU-006 TaxID=2704250 RepID=UPI001981797B|nr:16S rRNA (adenine(1518)-N(6)/adenine(1519)-N(6))-dimethyltransferase RsmA [Candidatus Roseilinea sp. NK_OTU-006]